MGTTANADAPVTVENCPAPAQLRGVSPFISAIAQGERGGWTIRLRALSSAPTSLAIIAEDRLHDPQVQYGRVKQPLWLRLTQEPADILGEMSLDGVIWSTLGKIPSSRIPLLAGITATSGIQDVEADVLFDHVV